LIVSSAPFSFAIFSFSSPKSNAIILAPNIDLANCIAIRPSPPAPTTTMLLSGFIPVFLTALYAVSAEQDKVDAASMSISFGNLRRYR
jgi:hypothetical protein